MAKALAYMKIDTSTEWLSVCDIYTIELLDYHALNTLITKLINWSNEIGRLIHYPQY